MIAATALRANRDARKKREADRLAEIARREQCNWMASGRGMKIPYPKEWEALWSRYGEEPPSDPSTVDWVKTEKGPWIDLGKYAGTYGGYTRPEPGHVLAGVPWPTEGEIHPWMDKTSTLMRRLLAIIGFNSPTGDKP